ncbi:MAG: polysaccharide biosynthesis tyrosine autokinase [Proteobacteria bacterium]|nr:polysaccharide biosynthesis tyrosine autokinase [Pseudomonadota bacterium]
MANHDQPPMMLKAQAENELSLRHYGRILLKRKALVLAVWGLVLGLVAVGVYSRPKVYKATATVLVFDRAPQVLGDDMHEVVELSTGSYYRSKEFLETQIKVVASRALARKVAERLQLDNDASFWSKGSGSASRARKGHTLDQAATHLQRLIEATAEPGASILRIAAKHSDPRVAARLANATAEAYLDQTVEYKVSSATGAAKWLALQLDDLKHQLDQAELALWEFNKKNNILSVSLEDRQSLLSARIAKFNDALTDLRLSRLALEAQRKQVLQARQQDPLDVSLHFVVEAGEIGKIREAYFEAEKTYRVLRQRYLDQHPLVLEQKAKVDAVKGELARAIRTVLDTTESRYRQTVDTEQRMAAALQEAKDEAMDVNKREVDYRRLKRSEENTEKIYTMVLTRLKESDLSGQLRVSNMRTLDVARRPEKPVFPRVALSMIVGGLLGLMLGVALAFVVESLDNSVKTHEDVESIPGLIHLGMLPHIGAVASVPARGANKAEPNDSDLVVHRAPKSISAEACRAIRTNLMFVATGQQIRRLLVTSPGPQEGKTTTAVSIAITMAQAGGRVLIVDTDMRRPRLHRTFGVSNSGGISTALLGSSAVADVIKSTEVPNLFVLPCGPTPPNPAELCQSDRFRALLEELTQLFDRVILDSPPVMLVTDAAILSTLVDGTLIVARAGVTSRVLLRAVAAQIQSVGGRLLGCVVNDLSAQKRGQSDYYRYAYRGYRYGYAENEDSSSS